MTKLVVSYDWTSYTARYRVVHFKPADNPAAQMYTLVYERLRDGEVIADDRQQMTAETFATLYQSVTRAFNETTKGLNHDTST